MREAFCCLIVSLPGKKNQKIQYCWYHLHPKLINNNNNNKKQTRNRPDNLNYAHKTAPDEILVLITFLRFLMSILKKKQHCYPVNFVWHPVQGVFLPCFLDYLHPWTDSGTTVMLTWETSVNEDEGMNEWMNVVILLTFMNEAPPPP